MVIELDDGGPESLCGVSPDLGLLSDFDASRLLDHVDDADRVDSVRGQVVDVEVVWLS